MARIAINGFGRIGRAFFKRALQEKDLDFVVINDLGDIENMVYLLKYDSSYGKFEGEVTHIQKDGKEYLVVDGPPSPNGSGETSKEVLFIQQKDPAQLPWKDLDIDIVIEATGIFNSFEKSKVHIDAGAKRVILTAPAKDEEHELGRTVLLGVNEKVLSTCSISSNGSCTTNSASPVMQILSESIGVKKAMLVTTHGYTSTQSLIDGPVKGSDFRKGRAAAHNIIPTTTGAAIAVARAVESLKDKFDGVAMRVPVITGSISAITFVSEKPTTVEELNEIFETACKEPQWNGVLKTTREQIVSSDILGDPYGAILDLSLTKVVDGDLCSIFSWYDNEAGYTETLVRHAIKAAATL